MRQTAHLLRIFERLQTEDVRRAFFELLHRIYADHALTVMCLSRGHFSAVHLLFDASGRPYADAEFAFKGAKDHMRWWFRPPCFEKGLLDPTEILGRLPCVIDRGDGHLVTDIRTYDDVDSVIGCVSLARERRLLS